jgi:SAM-dependent methyltransferase
MSAADHLRGIAHHALALLRGPGTPSPFADFLAPGALAINRARQTHLASLGLALEGKRVLEVGAGIGLHTPFFLERGCEVVVSDAHSGNLAEIRRRFPKLRVEHIDLAQPVDLRSLGTFDLIYCYGLLYHLGDPDAALRSLAPVCSGQLLLETMVALGRHAEVYRLRDPVGANQAVAGLGCRPTRLWVLQALQKHFGHGYVTRSQPDFPDFETDWELPRTRLVYRAVFVGSKAALDSAELLRDLPARQTKHRI